MFYNSGIDTIWLGYNISTIPFNHQGDYGDFYAVKLGDLNPGGSCGAGFTGDSEDRISAGMNMKITRNLSKNEVKVDFYKNSSIDWIAAQAGLKFDPSVIQLVKIIGNKDINVNAIDINDLGKNEGKLQFGWFAMDGETTIKDNPLLFSLIFKVEDGRKLDMNNFPLWISPELMPNLYFNTEGDEYTLQITARETGILPENSLKMAIVGNPVQETAVFNFVSGGEADILVEIGTINSGKINFSNKITLRPGENRWEFDAKTLPDGQYFIRVKGNDTQNLIQRFTVIHR
jgi:hypothetical protein